MVKEIIQLPLVLVLVLNVYNFENRVSFGGKLG